MSVTSWGDADPQTKGIIFSRELSSYFVGMLPLWHIFAVWPSFAPKSSSNQKKGAQKICHPLFPKSSSNQKEGNRCHHLMALPQFFLTKNTLTGQK